MSLYDLTKEISKVAKTKYIKKFKNDHIVAKFVKNGKDIELHYKNYTKKLLQEHMRRDYEEKYVYMDFWDPSFCNYTNIAEKDIKVIKQRFVFSDSDDKRVVVGYLVSLISLYKTILKSYVENKYDINSNVERFDKNILKRLLCDFDMVIGFNNNLIKFINNIFDEETIVDFMVTPSGKFRLIQEDIKYILSGTKKVHEISSMIVNTSTSVEKILNYHLELINVCVVIYSPELITSYRAENVLLNLLKLNIDMDKYERLLFRIVDKYIDKGGSLDIVFDIEDNKFENALILFDAIKEYRLSSNQGTF